MDGLSVGEKVRNHGELEEDRLAGRWEIKDSTFPGCLNDLLDFQRKVVRNRCVSPELCGCSGLEVGAKGRALGRGSAMATGGQQPHRKWRTCWLST